MHCLFSPPDWDTTWDTTSRRIPTATGAIRAEAFPQDDAHLIHLTLADNRILHLLVVPPAMSHEQGEEALLAAATPGYAHSARCLLTTVTDSPDHDPADHWTYDVGSRRDGSQPTPAAHAHLTMAYVMLYGAGWTQRWRLPPGGEQHVREEIERVGRPETSQLSILDPGSNAVTTLVINWSQVAAAAVLDADSDPAHEGPTGQYA